MQFDAQQSRLNAFKHFQSNGTHFTAGPPYSPQQLKSVLSAAATRSFRRTQASGPFGTRSRRHAGCNDQDYCRRAGNLLVPVKWPLDASP